MALKKLSAADLAKARAAGFKRKAPKKPKTNASLPVLENYVVRYNTWVTEAKDKIRSQAKRMSLLKAIK